MRTRLHVLIVDDSEDDRELYGRLLHADEEVEWLIREAETGEEGLEIYRSEEIDCVLLDYSLPGHDGLKVLSELSNGCPYPAVVMLTGQGNEVVAKEAMRNGAQDYLVKNNVTPEGLQKAIHNAIDRVTMMREIDEQREALQRFSMVLAHDLRTPIHHIRGFCDLVGMAIERGEYDKIRGYYEFIDQASWSMVKLIDTLTKYNSIDAGAVVFGPVSMQTVFDDALNNLSCVVDEKNARVTHGDLPEVKGNEPQLVQLLQNLIGNGIKYCRAEVPSVHVTAEKLDDGHRISVVDNGIGIPKEHHTRVFEPFRRLNGAGEFPGTGLGLAICKKIVDRHQGRIWCESGEDEGTVFSFTLPGRAARP